MFITCILYETNVWLMWFRIWPIQKKSQQNPNFGYKYLLNSIYTIIICQHWIYVSVIFLLKKNSKHITEHTCFVIEKSWPLFPLPPRAPRVKLQNEASKSRRDVDILMSRVLFYIDARWHRCRFRAMTNS